MKTATLIDYSISVLLTLIGVLLVTGGVHYSSSNLKLELSQIDLFAWIILILAILRKYKFGSFFSKKIETKFLALIESFSKHSSLWIFISIGIYFLSYFWFLSWRFDSFHANAFDMGYVDHALWSTTRYGFLHSTISKGHTYLGEHFSPILSVVGIGYLFFNSVYFVFAAQTLILSTSAILIYNLCRAKNLSSGYSVLLSILFLSYQPLRLANSFDFREDCFFVPVFLMMLLAIEKRNFAMFWISALASWTIKENAPLFTVFTGCWLILRKENSFKKTGALIAVLSLAFFVFLNTKITPIFAGSASETMAAKRLSKFGHNSSEILLFLFEHPILFLSEIAKPILQPKALKYFLNVTTPFLIFIPAEPFVFGIAFLGILMNLVVNAPTIGFHYECILLPFLFFLLVKGMSKWNLTTEKAMLLTLSFLLFFGRSPIEGIRRMIPNEHHRFISEELKKIPEHASIATESAIHPHLTHRKEAYLFSGQPFTDFVIADLSGSLDRYATPNLNSDLEKIDSKFYDKILDRNGLVIWKKK